jgi:tetratricopeptide (TPR) repeat protein
METTKIIEQYLDGTLTIDQQHEVEKRAELDAGFRELIRMHREVNESIGDKDFSDFINNVKKAEADFFNARSSVAQPKVYGIKRLTQNPVFRIASVVAFFIMAGIAIKYTLFNNMSTERLYQKYYSTYTADIVLRTLGDADNALEKAVLAYNQGEYAQALSLSDEILQTDKSNYGAWLFNGLAYLGTDQSANAINSFNKIPADWDCPLMELRNWYLALAQLHDGNKTEALKTLQSISASGGYYAEKAGTIIKKLKP